MTTVAHPATATRHAAYYRSHGRPEVAERLEAELVAAGRCRRCGATRVVAFRQPCHLATIGRALSVPASVAAGIGPECAGKVAGRA